MNKDGFECEGMPVSVEEMSAQNPHILIEGVSGSGKSICLQYFLRRSIDRGE